MTRGIDDMLGLPHLDEVIKQKMAEDNDDQGSEPTPEDTTVAAIKTKSVLETLEDSLRTFEGTDHAKAMDIIFSETLEHSRSLMDLAFNVDDRSRRGILEIATAMYKNSIDAKNSKRDAQLKLMQMLLAQRKQDFEERKWKTERGIDDGNEVSATATLIEDRNELIRRLRDQPKDPPKE